MRHRSGKSLSRQDLLALLACLSGSGTMSQHSPPPLPLPAALEQRRSCVDPSQDPGCIRRSLEQGVSRALVQYPGPELRLEQAAMCWTEQQQEEEEEMEETPADGRGGGGGGGGDLQRVSVIVVEFRRHNSNHFRDKERVRAYGSRVGGSSDAVVSVQYISPFPEGSLAESGGAPFGAAHPEGVDKRVRIVFVADMDYLEPLDEYQLEHLSAACEDPSETTVLAIVDETCRWHPQERHVPTKCLANVVRTYPLNVAWAGEEFRTAYLPLGPRDTFPFIAANLRRPASVRPVFFNLVIRPRTSERRQELIAIAQEYSAANPDLNCLPGGGIVDEREYPSVLLDSRFTLSPAGHNAECFRTWEALEAGSIPIVSQLDFTNQEYSLPRGHNCGIGSVSWNTVAGAPFAKQVSVADWRGLPALLDRLQREPDDFVDKLQEDSVAWYEAVMKQTYRSMLNFGGSGDLFPQDGPILERRGDSA